jgi:hypothetical protein
MAEVGAPVTSSCAARRTAAPMPYNFTLRLSDPYIASGLK